MKAEDEEEEVDNIDYQQVEELYKAGMGLKRVARELGTQPMYVKRLLIRGGSYEGASHQTAAAAPAIAEHPDVQIEHQPLSFDAEDMPEFLAFDPTNMLSYQHSETVHVEAWEHGWIVDFQQTGWVRCLLPGAGGREVTWKARARLLEPSGASFVLRLVDDTGAERRECTLFSSHDPRGSWWSISRRVDEGAYLEIVARDNASSFSTLFFSDISLEVN